MATYIETTVPHPHNFYRSFVCSECGETSNISIDGGLPIPPKECLGCKAPFTGPTPPKQQKL